MAGKKRILNGSRRSRRAAALAASLLPALSGLAPGADCNGNGIDDALDLAPGDPGFAAVRFVPLDREPIAVAAADLDGDGRTDAAVATPFGLSIFENDGTGGLSAAGEVVIGSNPRDVTAADLDGDGDLDLATANAVAGPLPGNVSVLLNTGGALAAPRNYAADQFPTALVAADLDGDGDRDLAAANAAAGNVSILLNRGDGAFTAGETASLGGGGEIPNSLAAADLDGDGDADLASAQRNSERRVSVLANDGQARFPAVKGLAIERASPNGLAVDDFDGDGDPDLVTANQTLEAEGRSSTFFENAGSGEFAPARPISPGDLYPAHFTALAAGDLDRDGDPDLVLATRFPEFVLRLNAGDAVFVEAAHYSLPAPAVPLELIEIDGAAPIDLIAAHPSAKGLSVVSGRQEGLFSAPARLPVENADFTAVADVDGDGDLELATGGEDENALLLFTASTPGAYGEPARFPLGGPTGFAAADLDGDLHADLAVTADEGLWVFPGLGAAAFAAPTRFTTEPASVGYAPALVDLDGDDDLDIAFASGYSPWLNVAVNQGKGVFALAPAISAGEQGPVGQVFTADLEGDGDLDFLTLDEGRPGTESPELVTALNDGAGRLTGRRQTLATEAREILAGDLNGDRRLDVLLHQRDDPRGPFSIVVYLQDAEGAFPPGPPWELPGAISSPAAADLDGDRDLDLAFVDGSGVRVARNDGAGMFGASEAFDLDATLSDLEAGDFDGDLDVDLAAAGQVLDPARGLEGSIVLLLNEGRGTFAAPLSIPAGTLFGALQAADFDGDRLLDLAVQGREEVIVLENQAVPPASLDRDRDGIPDECPAEGRRFHRGDATGDGSLNITDPVALLNHLFRGAPAPGCREAADADNDGAAVITDAVALLGFLFQGGPPPAAPGPPAQACGPDPDPPGSPGDLGCDEYPACGA